ncbi:hypothetical protein CHGG_00372 [Chaetomium globosum CBS 148.51]|uniref:Uncharacterized protein n=1 Tax=Chaetomium globosum (strain ATCC 6205 / CBS 148.51 / DSM 1962 / NBRC 6347 / NRRL 1970) TaxID=306901 RepID=Q2HHD2_CHAGB|nr:uncharacterized protein CHGG_00372 [Chaetomium globosum CBS 148.51]EAQ92137.1 hypothetical protein CHGG_00372 [Chaetomium globosum CBS 148.51]
MASKSIIVTGGASGIGLAVTRHLAAQGHRVAILDLNAAAGPAVAAEVAAEFPRAAVSFHPCDVASWDEQAAAFRQAFAELGGRLDVVVANAGVSEQGATSLVRLPLGGGVEGEGPGEGEDEGPTRPSVATLQVNLLGTVYSVNLAVHYMNKKPKSEPGGPSRGSIICTASNAGLYPLPVAPLYAASKFGVVGLVRSTARIIAQANMQINALAPAVLDTNIAPDKSLFKHMTITPMETLIRGVDQFLADPTVSGAVAEIHGDRVTIRPPHEYVDEDSKKNIDTFWDLGRIDRMDIRTEPFRRPGKAPLLWNRTVCDCHWYYQFYLCGCPDRATPIGNGRTRHEPCYQGCEVWYKPKWEQIIKLSSGFRHNPNPPLRPEPSVLPFPCHRHLMESRVFLSAEELHTMRNRLMDPMWNPVRSSTWEDKKRVREEEDDGLPPPPPLRRRILQPEAEEIIQLQPMIGGLMLALRQTPNDHHYIDPPTSSTAFPSPLSYPWHFPSGQSAFLDPDGPRTFAVPDESDEESTQSRRSLARSPPPPYVGPPAYTRNPPRPAPPPAPPRESPPPYIETPSSSSASPQRSTQDASEPRQNHPPRRSRNHFSSLTWLLEEQAIDLWRQDGYHWHSAPVKRERATPTTTTTKTPQTNNHNPHPNLSATAPLIRDVTYDGPTHTGYFHGAYRTDPAMLHQARAVSWQRAAGEEGLAWARRVGEACAEGGVVLGGGNGSGGGNGGNGGWWLLGARFHM